MKRYNQILTGILVIQIALSVVVFWPESAATGGEPLFPDLEAGDIVSLTITDADGNSIALAQLPSPTSPPTLGGTEGRQRGAGGEGRGDWVLPDAGDYPAQADKVTPLLEKIAGLTTGRLVARTDASHRRLQVAPDDFVSRIQFETADGAKHVLYLGSSPSYGATHFRLDGQSETYLTSDVSTWDANSSAASWIDTSYVSLDKERLTRVTLENTNGTFVFIRDDAGEWAMAGLEASEELASGKVTTLVNRATSVTLLRPLGTEEDAAYGLDDPLATVTLEMGDETVTLQVGAQDADDSSYVVKSSASPYYVRVAEYNVKPLVENRRDDFLQLPPTPTPEPTPTSVGDTNTEK